ncbi:fused MFS/spermidine synthase [Thermostichus vulcanus]|uniref:Polyamine aminopropyltransferase n=1 Tax=Thermostichus vulcanus str. 'Rupite' TaxID=2813851 RepID=A0ABT0C6F6_THEVL|nr:fused MFS/spermidine synthase [Thermostichus vulcanus]MCJ2541388.1 fused MFS/spermidine synthase [Thermostichus vulcanus str. 'Rupite']
MYTPGIPLWIQEYSTPWDGSVRGITRILAYRRTPFQEMLIVETGAYGKGLVLDGRWQSTTADEFLYHEALVHPALLQVVQGGGIPKRILVLGGAEGATVREVLRWRSVEQVVMVDIDGEVVEACREHLPEMHQGALEDARVQVVIADALEFLHHTGPIWDVILSDLSDPIESGPAYRLFTQEFFRQIRSKLQPDGAFVVQAGPVGPVEFRQHTRIIHTLQTVFAAVQSYAIYTPTYGGPLGFALCAHQPIPSRPDPDSIDLVLRQQLDPSRGALRFIDGTTLLGLYQVPAHLRRAIAEETTVYTLDNPPHIE